jgi:hypothetical protein
VRENVKPGIKSALRHSACRSAVLFPVVGRSWPVEETYESMKRLRAYWCCRLQDWRALDNWDHEHLFPGASCTFRTMECCPWFGLHYQVKSYTCRRPLVCPFCWARRYVLDPFVHLEKILYGSTKPRSPLIVPADTVLVRFQFQHRLRLGASTPWTDAWRATLYGAARTLIQTRSERSREVARCPDLWGGFVLHRVEIKPEDKELVYERSGVLVVPAGGFRPGRYDDNVDFKYQVYPGLRRLDLLRAVARACRYPASVLKLGIRDVETFLPAFKGVRMLTKYGPSAGLNTF